MSMVVLTGGARSGKSGVAQRMALMHEGSVVVAVAGKPDDPEMQRRIERHQEERPSTFVTLEIDDAEDWLHLVPGEALLVVDCLTTLVGRILGDVWVEHGGEQVETDGLVSERLEEAAMLRVETLVASLASRRGETIVVTSEVGAGVVPGYPMGRLYRDLIGAANRSLVEAAEGAWLVVAGRCLDLRILPSTPRWPMGTQRRHRA